MATLTDATLGTLELGGAQTAGVPSMKLILHRVGEDPGRKVVVAPDVRAVAMARGGRPLDLTAAGRAKIDVTPRARSLNLGKGD